MAGDSMGMSILGATYPLELLADAIRLARDAANQEQRPTASPEERSYSRAAIFTAFNFLESLWIELVQERIRVPHHEVKSHWKRNCRLWTSRRRSTREIIEGQLRSGRASISSTIREWPQLLGLQELHSRAEFRSFKEFRQLRNRLIHPKLDPLVPGEPNQDELLRLANRDKAAWAVTESKRMAAVLYRQFDQRVPPEVEDS